MAGSHVNENTLYTDKKIYQTNCENWSYKSPNQIIGKGNPTARKIEHVKIAISVHKGKWKQER